MNANNGDNMVRVRFAPSPTGRLHVGNVRTALFNYLFARHNNGINILRIEDTDKERSTKESEKKLIELLKWLGLDWDEGVEKGGEYGPYHQSERMDIYKKYAEQLVKEGKAFYCYCTEAELQEKREKAIAEGRQPHYDGHCRHLTEEQRKAYEAEGRKPVIRFLVDETKDYHFKDLVHGDINIQRGGIGDFVLLRSDGLPVYNFACVIDDHLMKITHVLRGDDHLYNTLRQVMLYEAFGWDMPQFAHLSMILAPDKSKLSKRAGVKYTFIEEFKEAGFLKEALLNYLALLGWMPENEQEIMNMEEMIKYFTIERVSHSPAVFDFEKLKWMNGKYIREIDDELYYKYARPFVDKYFSYLNEDVYRRALSLGRKYLTTLDDVKDALKGLLPDKNGKYEVVYSDDMKAIFIELEGEALLRKFLEIVEAEDTNYIDYKETLTRLKKESGVKGKKLFMPLRIAITGQEHGPDMGEIFFVLSKEEIKRRVKLFLDSL